MRKRKINPALLKRSENRKRTRIQIECFKRLTTAIEGFPAQVQRQSVLAYWKLIQP